MSINFLEWEKPNFNIFQVLQQFLHYLDVKSQDENTESVILHVVVKNVLQASTETNIDIFSIMSKK